MAKTSVKLYMTNKTIEFSSESIVSLEFEQQSTSDYSRPVYDIYPAYGTLVVKDKDLSLYNMALNGEFDNYNYKIEVFVNNSKVARLYITELPVYSYEDKTLSMVLGDELTKATTKIYAGYDYPLEPKTLFDVALAVLKAFDSTITETSAVFTQSMWSATQTYADYLKTISIEYPYVPANRTFRQVFKQLLTVAQSALVTDVNTVYRFVRMDGAKNTSNDKAIGILSSQITSQFQPTIIVPNKYDSCDVDCDKVSVEYNVNTVAHTKEIDLTDNDYIVIETNQDTDTSNSIINNSYSKTGSAGAVYQGSFGYITFTGTNYIRVYSVPEGIFSDDDPQKIFENQIYNFDKLQNQNLIEIKRIIHNSEDGNGDPVYNVSYKQVTKRIKGYFTANWDSSQNSYVVNKSSFISTGQEEFVSEKLLTSTNFTNTVSTIVGRTLTVKGIQYTDLGIVDEYNDVYVDKSKVTIGNKFFIYFTGNAPSDGEAPTGAYEVNRYDDYLNPISQHTIDGYKYIIENIPQKLSITYNGDYTEVVFKDDTATKLKTTNVKDNTASIMDGGELMQYSASKTNSRPLKIAENTLKVFQNGLNGGDIECIAWDYSYLNTYVYPIQYNSTTENLKKFFSVGDMVVPCKSRKSEPVYTRNSAPVYFNVVKNAITYLNGGFRQRMILRESVRDSSKTKLDTPTISTFNLYLPRYSASIQNFDEDAEKVIVYADGNEIGTLSASEIQRGNLNQIYFIVSQLSGWKGLTVGSHLITIKLTAQGLTDSDLSNSDTIQRGYDITYALSHVSLVPVYITNEYITEINQNESLSLGFNVEEGYTFPTAITVTNATYTWNSENGSLTLSNATGNVLITITAVQSQITPLISHYGGTTIIIEQIDERAEQISVRANDSVIGTVAKLPTVPEEGAPSVTVKNSGTEIEVDDINANAQKLAVYANGIKIGEVEI